LAIVRGAPLGRRGTLVDMFRIGFIAADPSSHLDIDACEPDSFFSRIGPASRAVPDCRPGSLSGCILRGSEAA
jgi:hypothetical protein